MASADTAVLLVGNFLHASGGTYGVCEELAAQLAGRGWTVFTTSSRRNPVARLADMIGTAVSRRSDYGIAQVDVYSGRAFIWADTVTRALRLMHKPYVLTLHGGSLPEFAARNPSRVTRLLRSAAAVTTPSRFLLEAMAPYRSDLRLHPNPVPLDRYEFRTRTTVHPRLLWLRAFDNVYDPLTAIDVVAQLRQRFPDVHLTMVGPDRRDGSLARTQDAVRARGLAASVTIAGPVAKAEVPRLMNAADVFLNTSRVDNAPVSVLEAQASGLCVVTTAVGGIVHLVQHERNALLVRAGDPTAMASAVDRVLSEPGLAARLSEGGRENAAGRDCSVVMPLWETLLREHAAGRPRPMHTTAADTA